MEAAELYLKLLKKSLTNTLFEEEPDADNPNQTSYVSAFISHYIRGVALSMLPVVRLDNLQSCIADTISKDVPGDLIETGVWRGGATIFMRAMLKVHGVTDKRVWVADSFQGLPEPDPKKFPVEANFRNSKIMKSYYNNFAVSLDEVAANFKAYDMLDEQVRFLKGWFKDTLPTAPIDKLSIIRLDGDYYESTMDGLVNLYDKLSIGGYVIVDDYGEDAWTNCRQAVDEFRRNRKIEDPLLPVDSRCYYWRRTS